MCPAAWQLKYHLLLAIILLSFSLPFPVLFLVTNGRSWLYWGLTCFSDSKKLCRKRSIWGVTAMLQGKKKIKNHTFGLSPLQDHFLYLCTIFSMAAIYLRKNSHYSHVFLYFYYGEQVHEYFVCQNIPSTWCFYFLEVDKVKGRKIWQRQLMAGEKCSDMGKKRIYASTQWHARRHHNSDHFCPMFSPDTSSVCDNLTLRDRFTEQNVKKKRMWILLVQLFTWNGNLSSETVDPFTKVLGRTQRPGSR